MYEDTDEAEIDGSHESAQRKRQGVSSKRNFDSDALKIKAEGRDELLFILGRDNCRLKEWRVQHGALVFPDWCNSLLVIGGKEETKELLQNTIEDLRENKKVTEFFVPQVVNMSFLVGHNCKNLKLIEEKTDTFLRPKGSHKTIMIAGQSRDVCEDAKKMLKDLCGNCLLPAQDAGKVITLEPTACSHILLDGNLPRTASVVFMEKSYGYIPPTAQGRHARVLGIEEGQAFLEDTDANKLSLGAPDPDNQQDGAMQQARPLGSLLQTNSEFIQQCLFMFLNEVRPYKGVVKLSGSYGKFMFLDLVEDVTSVCWRIEEFAYQTLLFNLQRIFSPRCVLMEENIADKLGGIIEECYIIYEFKLHDKSTKCRSSVLTCKEVISEGPSTASTFELIHVTADNKKEKEFTKAGDLNPNRYERFTADVVCVDRKVDFQLILDCKEVLLNDNYNLFTERLSVEGEGAGRQMSFDGDIKDINVMSVTQKGVTVIGVGSVKLSLLTCKKGTLDSNRVTFTEQPVTHIEVGSKVWENAFTENFLAAYDEESASNMTWSAEQLLTKDLEDFMNVMQQASSFIKPQ